MEKFTAYLNNIGEIGYVEQVSDAIVYASGLPTAKPDEMVIFESGELGQIFSLLPDLLEILVFSTSSIKPGVKLTRTNKSLEIAVGPELLGRVVDPLGNSIDSQKPLAKPSALRPLTTTPLGITKRKIVTRPLETGVSIVDLAIPLGHGQRELVIGDRKTGKTAFLLQAGLSQAKLGNICIYAAIGKKKLDVKEIEEFFLKHKVMGNIVIVASWADDPAGIIYLTPYSAMTISEYFRDQGRDVLLVLDDLSTHAKYYREISLLGKRFPGRNSYPGDIFYTHARLLERAGNFIAKKGENSITCLPVAETIQGDLSGYIQTNLMSMTDGHLYFDGDLFSQGRRPPINPSLSVTRVGRQTQSKLRREINREVISFLSLFDRMQNFAHFGTELSESVKATLSMGQKIIQLFQQTPGTNIPVNVQIALFAMLWTNVWQGKTEDIMKKDMENIILAYDSNKKLREDIDSLAQTDSFNDLLVNLKTKGDSLLRAVQGAKI